MLQIATLNVNGLNHDAKRKEMFLYLKRMQFDIILLQETHSKKCKESIWNNEWGAKNLYSHGENNACGAMIMFKPELPIEIKKCTISNKGRYISADIEIENKVILSQCLYTK